MISNFRQALIIIYLIYSSLIDHVSPLADPQMSELGLNSLSSPDPTLFYALSTDNQPSKQHTDTLGHYEFEVAPKLEPPTVRKPPYEQSNQQCAPSDPFGGFQARDTLCGDLNQGRVPLNPLGQNIADQPYPFDLIKNKTLQFLAKALPILKEEYETIPKVARYLPSPQTSSSTSTLPQTLQPSSDHHMLNPTHHSSILSEEQMDQINRILMDSPMSQVNLAAGANQMMSLAGIDYPPVPPYKRRRRRRRSTRGSEDFVVRPSGQLGRAELVAVPIEQHLSGITVGELGSNVSLVVSSAHSGPSRSMNMLRHTELHFETPGEGSVELAPAPTLLARDGSQKRASPLINRGRNSTILRINHPTSAKLSGPNPREQTLVYSNIQMSGQTSAKQQQQQHHDQDDHQEKRVDPNFTPKRTIINNNDPQNNEEFQTEMRTVNQHQQRQQQQQQQNSAQTYAASENHATSNANQQQQQQQQHQQIKAKQPSPIPTTTTTTANPNVPDSNQTGDSSKSQAADQQHSPTGPTKTLSPASSTRQTAKSGQQSSSSDRQRKVAASSPCGDQSGLTATICQVANAFVDGGSTSRNQPSWLQLATQMANLYSPPSDNSLWSSFSSFFGVGGDKLEAKSSPPPSAKQQPTSPMTSQIIDMLSSMFSTGSSQSPPGKINHGSKVSTEQRATAKENKQKESPPSPFNSLSNKLLQLAFAAWATNKLNSMTDSFLPNLASSFGPSGFAKRKKMADPREQFVDTPASIAAAAAAATNQRAQQQQSPLTAKQPPTPCPSVEEYISPTFARNYQGAWKYVVQIPAEGYFTQTIQRTSCIRQKCEFTEGVCHESPRWVSLLVAEIYYPNAVFAGQTTPNSPIHQTMSANALPSELQSSSSPQFQMASHASKRQSSTLVSSPTMHHIQQRHLNTNANNNNNNRPKSGVQDPLQMIDSLNTYNHNNFNNFNAANELSGYTTTSNLNSLNWATDPLTTSQLMTAGYPNNGYSLQQRTGLSQSASKVNGDKNINNKVNVPAAANLYNIYQNNNQNQLQQQQVDASQINNQEYLTALALTLQQNPNLSVEQLLQSLQYPVYLQQQQQQLNARKKRDINGQQQQYQQAQMIQDQGHVQYTPTNQQMSQLEQQQQQMNQLALQQQLFQRNGQLENRGSINELNSNPQIVSANSNQQGAIQNTGATNVNPLPQKMDNLAQTSTSVMPSATMQVPSNQPDLRGPVNQPQTMDTAATSSTSTSEKQTTNVQHLSQLSPQANQVQQGQTQGATVDCDGVDRIGCYVVRVYYDWFLVNGSCKCWKTSPTNGQNSSAGSGSTNSFLRRIFTG